MINWLNDYFDDEIPSRVDNLCDHFDLLEEKMKELIAVLKLSDPTYPEVDDVQEQILLHLLELVEKLITIAKGREE